MTWRVTGCPWLIIMLFLRMSACAFINLVDPAQTGIVPQDWCGSMPRGTETHRECELEKVGIALFPLFAQPRRPPRRLSFLSYRTSADCDDYAGHSRLSLDLQNTYHRAVAGGWGGPTIP